MISYEYGLWVKACYVDTQRGPASLCGTDNGKKEKGEKRRLPQSPVTPSQ